MQETDTNSFHYLLSILHSSPTPGQWTLKSRVMHLAEPSVLNYLGPVPPSAFHCN